MSAIDTEILGRRRTAVQPDRTPEEAFRINLRRNLEAVFSDRLHPDHLRLAVHELAAAYCRVRHIFEARAAAPAPGGRRYVVLQFGVAPSRERAVGPLAAKVLARAPAGVVAPLSRRERIELAACIERAEIASAHPTDWRPRLNVGPWRIYLNLLAGRNRRRFASAANPERRAPFDEIAGAAALIFAAGFVAASLWLIGGLVSDAFAVFSDPEVKPAMWGALGF